MNCKHTKCHPTDRLWIPSHVDEEGTETEKIKPHYFCVECGEIEYKGPYKARDYGYFSNILGEIRRYLEIEARKGGTAKMTSTLVRLIIKDLHKTEDFSDRFSKSFSSQKDEFVRILRKYLPSYSREFFEAFFDPTPPVFDDADVNYYGKYYDDLEEKYAKKIENDKGDYTFY